MKQKILLFVLLLSTLSSCKVLELSKGKKSSDLSLLKEYMTGSFNSYNQSFKDNNYYNVNLEMHPIWEDNKNGYWLYVEQAIATMPNKPYRQRVYHLTKTATDTFSSTIYALPNPERFVGQWHNTELFNSITPDSLTIKEGCAIKLLKRADVFIGSTNGNACKSTLRGATYAKATARITKSRLESWDRGFDKEDKQVWGATKGPYVFDKTTPMKLTYPTAKREDIVEDYHGTKVSDPYRWLEDENSEETKDWIKAQNRLTNRYLKNIGFREPIKQRLEKVWNFPKYGRPVKKGAYYYFSKNDGLQNHAILYQQKGLDGTPTVFLDPNTFSKDGAISLGQYAFSHDGKYFAYATSEGGSDWRTFHIMEVATKKKLTEELNNIKFSSIAWYKDGFFYKKYDLLDKTKALSEKNQTAKLYYHKVGTPQEKDVLVYQNKKENSSSFWAMTTEEENYLFLYTSKAAGHGNALSFLPLKQWKKGKFTTIIKDYKSNNSIVKVMDKKILVNTNRNAPKNKLVLIDLYQPNEKHWKSVIKEKEETLRGVKVINDKLIVHYMKDVASHLYVYNMKGEKEQEIELPTLGTINGFSGGKGDKFMFYNFSSYLYPATIFKYDFATQKSTVFRQPTLDFKATDYETKQVFYKSKDGTKIPMFLTYKKGTTLTGNNPTLLYGYGGFNISRIPEFKIENIPFYEAGGIYAVANLRGGSEYGEDWHKSGMLDKKQNVFDDFIAAAEYLIAEKYTNKDKLAITGRSNGGLLVGAVANQRPDLFKVAIPVVGVMDMLRFQKFTIGWAWTGEYGTSEKKGQFPFLYAYSPYHNIQKDVDYPATLVLTAERDDRVVPAHSYKYISALQHEHQGLNPTLIRIERKAGHGSGGNGKTTKQKIDDFADRWTFIFRNLGMFPTQVK